MTIKHVVIHPGHAHRDEFLALGIAINAELIDYNTPVYRLDPTEQDLQDPRVLVLDVGRQYQPELNNFDHHQFERGIEECAMSLLAKHATLIVSSNDEEMTYHELLKDQPWYQAVIIGDALGPYELAKRAGLESPSLLLQSPIETSVIEYLESQPQGPQGCGQKKINKDILILANNIIEFRVNAALRLKARLNELEREAYFIKVVNHDNAPAGFNAMLFDGDDFGIHAFRDKNNLNFAVSITAAERSEGWALFRFDDDPRIDFSKLKDEEHVSFAHAGGFYAETKKKVDRETLLVLLSKAVTDQPVLSK